MQPRIPSSSSSFKSTVAVDSIFFKRLWRILAFLFQRGHNSVLWPYIGLIITSLMYEGIVWFVGTTAAKFYLVLPNRDFNGFIQVVIQCVLLYIAISIAKGSQEFVGGVMALRARRRLSKWLHEGYVKSGSLYRIASLAADAPGNDLVGELVIDNPDQTITQDIDKMTQEIRKILEQLAIDPLLIVYYTYKTASIGGSFKGPLVIYLFFALSAIACKAAMNPLVPLVYRKERSEGDFRHLHNTIRDSSEAFSLLKAENAERKRLDGYLERLLNVQWLVILWGFLLKVVMELVNYFGSCVAYLIVAIPIFDGTLDGKTSAEISEIVAKNLFVSLYLIFKFTQITDLAQRYSDLAGYTARVGKLLEAIDSLQTPGNVSSANKHDAEIEDAVYTPDFNPTPPCVAVRNLTLIHPHSTSQPIFSNLTFSVKTNQHTLIMGPSGIGKTSLFRVLSGLWADYEGKVRVLGHEVSQFGVDAGFDPSECIFVPQTPFLAPSASLRAQIAYPEDPDFVGLTDDMVIDILGKLGVEYLVERESMYLAQRQMGGIERDEFDELAEEAAAVKVKKARRRCGVCVGGRNRDSIAMDNDYDFCSMLSIGERQRVVFARILFWKPQVVFVDEGTSAVDAENEEKMWDAVFGLGTCTVVAVSHRDIAGFKQKVLLR
ncbi:ATP-binding cassette sub- D member 4 [Blyttiomyces sp. JEL0837]|nr:ATP-binding cassette sub- D member 4 [Blyttiomyces sp. JEL0837]